MHDETAWNLLVFRDAVRSVSSREVVASLRDLLAETTAHEATEDAIVSALLAVGEFEGALADSGSPAEAAAQKLTDFLALRLFAPAMAANQPAPPVPETNLPLHLRISPHEGFAYYALHPLDFGCLAQTISAAGSAAVIGIRSIGTTLSAAAAAALIANGIPAGRTTVRPTGHPYNRQLDFSDEQNAWIREHCQRRSQFLVADEGPGISGSSFLSVGEALARAGVHQNSITFLCTRRPDPAHLKAPDASRRWTSFRALYLENGSRVPQEALVPLSGGQWRSVFLPPSSEWPAAWTSMERNKSLSADRRSFFKFEGLGHYGSEVRVRGHILANAGVAPSPDATQNGFTQYPVITGTVLSVSDLNANVLSRMAQYCAFRQTHIKSAAPATDLTPMVRHNIEQEFGSAGTSFMLEAHSSDVVIPDARMFPHDWIRSSDGRLFKVDGTCHGDDHFFPGPADIAWDLAGAIVEWDMNASVAKYFLDEYRRSSGDSGIAIRLPGYLLAYSVFRMAYCRMAAAAMAGHDEQLRLQRAYEHYRREVARRLLFQSEPRSSFTHIAAEVT